MNRNWTEGDASITFAVRDLRAERWKGVPVEPGVYWWYFPPSCIKSLRISKHCDLDALNLRRDVNGKVCLYHGTAANLRQRIRWHAEQELTLSAIRSGFLSTLRFTLLALTDADYTLGRSEIDGFIDRLHLVWRLSSSKAEAKESESAEFLGPFHYPLNISGNRRVELSAYVGHLLATRKSYKKSYA